MLGWSGQLPDGQETSMGWERDGMDATQCRGVVAQRKLFGVVTGKRNVSKVSPGLGWYQYLNSGILYTRVNDSMVVKTANSHR